jgi:hypothetical protein
MCTRVSYGSSLAPIVPIVTIVSAVLAIASPSAAWAEPLGAVEPNADEQAGIYELNRARNDPAAYGDSIGVDLSGVTARPPLAVNQNLTGAARFHAAEMEDDAHEYFAHVSAVTGDGPNQMAVQNGYDLFGDGLAKDWGTTNTIESIARGINQMATYPAALAVLIEDAGVAGLGHRVHLLATVEQFAEHREIGAGYVTGKVATATDQVPAQFVGKPEYLYSIMTANVDPADRFITGVVYDDDNANGRYDRGEGLGGVKVNVSGEATNVDVTTMAAGGYSVKVPAGTFTVTVGGAPFAGTSDAHVTVGADNVEVDFASGLGFGEVDFQFRNAPPPPRRAFALQKGKMKQGKTGLWSLNAKGILFPGIAQFDGDPTAVGITIDGVPYLGNDTVDGIKVKTKLDKTTGKIVAMTVTYSNKDKYSLDLVKGKLTLALKNITDESLNFEDGVDMVFRIGSSRASLTAPAVVDGTKATLEPTEGIVEDLGG